MNKVTLPRWRAGLLAVVIAAAVLPALQPRPALADPPSALEFSVTGFEGAGFQNVMAQRGEVVLLGGDVSGIHRSTDLGTHWVPENAGLEAEMPRFLGMADLAFSDTVTDEVYACGLKGFYASTDAGQSWALRSSEVPTCSGGNNMSDSSLPATHPRSTGDLIVQAGGLLYVGSFRDGVFRSGDDGLTWTPIALTPVPIPDPPGTPDKEYFIRSLVGDPADPDALYAATYGDRVWKITGASTAPVATQLAASPVTVEEFAAVGSSVFAVAGDDGVFVTTDGGATWPARNTGVDVDKSADWESIAGFVASGGNTVLYIGANDPVLDNAIANSVMKSTNGGVSWTSVTMEPAKVHGNVGGPGGHTWWFYDAKQPFRIGKRGFVAAQIVVDATDPNVVYVAGRAGAWRSTDAGTNWYPIVAGVGTTINRGVAVDPANANRVYVSNTDWMQVRSVDGMQTVVSDSPPSGTAAFDTVLYNGRSYVAAGDRDLNNAGNVWSKPLDGSGTWTDENLDAVAGNKRPLAVAAGHDAGGQKVILAAVHAGGVYRKVGSTWTNVSGAAGPFLGEQATKRGYFSWAPDSADVYLYDRPTGLWRSRDYGVTWTLAWALPSNNEHTGYVAVDPLNPDVAYVSANAGFFQLTGLSTGTTVEDTSITATPLPAVPNPGPIAVAASAGATFVYVAARSGLAPYAPPGLYFSNNGVDWTDVADNLYREVALIPHQLAIGPDGRVWAALDGNGVIVGRVPPPPDFDPPDTTILSGPSGTVTSTSAVFTFNATEPFSTFACTLDGVTSSCTSPASYTVANGTHSFAVVATDQAGNPDPSPATADWTVDAPANPPPANDNFASATAITGNVGAFTRDTTAATKQAGEPSHAGNAGGHSVWFTYKPTAAGALTLTTAGSGFATLLAVYTGTAVGSLTPVASTASGKLTFNATAGTTYRIAVDGQDGATGNAQFNLPVIVTDAAFKPNPGTTAPLGAAVQWEFTGSNNQRVLSQSGFFDSGPLGTGSRFLFTFNAAGTYWYNSIAASMKGRVAVPMTASPKQGPRTTNFTITWARAATSGLTYDVQMKAPGSSTWTMWKSNVSALNASWIPGGSAPKGTYSFQARARLGSNLSGWSTTQTVKVQ
jgi:plastocyanin